MNAKLFIISSVFASLFAPLVSNAEIKLPKIFSDNMVVQKDEPFKMWGSAEPMAKVEAIFAKQSRVVEADKNGEWSLKFDAVGADKKPQTIKIIESGNGCAEIKNVLVGEVWVLGGQSNMNMWLGAYLERTKDTGEYRKAIERSSEHTCMRYFTQPDYTIKGKPQKDFPKGSKWIVPNPDNAAKISAIGYFFAENLLKDLDVPVGIIETSRGGSAMVAWIPESDIYRCEYAKQILAKHNKEKAVYNYEESLKKYNERIAEQKQKEIDAQKTGKKIAPLPWKETVRPIPEVPWGINDAPCYLYNGKVAPLVGYNARGVLWYQGESDAYGEKLNNFIPQFKAIIDSWREKWNNDELPFVYVQLSSFENNGDWPETRWQQYRAKKYINNIFMANIIDLGERYDIHPKYKAEVGRRLEQIALREVYGDRKISPYGPDFSKINYNRNSAKIEFNTHGKELIGDGEARGFEVFVEGRWLSAKGAKLFGKNFVEVYANDGDKVDGVRYLWKSWAGDDIWLRDSSGLPAGGFISEKSIRANE